MDTTKKDHDKHQEPESSLDLTGEKGTLATQLRESDAPRTSRALPTLSKDDGMAGFFGSTRMNTARTTDVVRDRTGYEGKAFGPGTKPRSMSLPRFSRLPDRGYEPSASTGVPQGNARAHATEGIASSGFPQGTLPSPTTTKEHTPDAIGKGAASSGTGDVAAAEKLQTELRDTAAEQKWPTPPGDYPDYLRATHAVSRQFNPLAAVRQWATEGRLTPLMANKTWASALGPIVAQNRVELDRLETAASK